MKSAFTITAVVTLQTEGINNKWFSKEQYDEAVVTLQTEGINN